MAITQWNINTHGTLSSKTQWFCFNWKEAIWSLTKKIKQGDKREKLTESLHLTVKIARRSNYNIWSQKTSRKQNHRPPKPQSGSKWKTYRFSAMILHSQFKLAFQFRRKEDLLFKIKIKLIEMFNWAQRKKARDAIRWISSDNPAKFF